MNKLPIYLSWILFPVAGSGYFNLPHSELFIQNGNIELHWQGKADVYTSGDMLSWNLMEASQVSPFVSPVAESQFYQLGYKALNYTVVDTAQAEAYDQDGQMVDPLPGQSLYGQDAVYSGNQPTYTANGDGTVTDNNTGLMWQQVPPEAFYSWEAAQAYAENLVLAGHDDWRLPTMKESLSLADFRGSSRPEINRPYIDDTVFTIHDPLTVTTYVPASAENPNQAKRNIDGQYWSSNAYVGRTMNNDTSTFGFNFIDGRIKSYPNGISGPTGTCFVRCVRGSADYGENNFINNGDGTITDLATGLMWMQQDSGSTMDWIEALDWAENLEYAGYHDWRLPNAKELHTLVDYTRAPDAENPLYQTPAIDPIFSVSETESWFWTSTSLGDDLFEWAIYICFGQATAIDAATGLPTINAHGAGAMRSDPKTGDPADFVGASGGHGPQNDQVRIQNYVRPVRTAFTEQDLNPVTDQPNILLLIVDDWGIDSSSLYNPDSSISQAPMPTLQSLANEGLVFLNAYAQPTCSPTRANILTGRYSFRHGIGTPVNASTQLSESEITLPEIFATAGSPYQLGSFGKYHLNIGGGPQASAQTPNTIAGWPHYAGSLGGGVPDYYNWTKVTNGSVQSNITDYVTTVTIDDASQWIQQQGEEPWLCWIGFNAAHTPFHNPPEDLHSYSGIPDDPLGANRRPAYEAALEALDTEIGRLMESVDISNTLIIVMGDNGTPGSVVQEPFYGEHAKGSVYEGGTHVPFFITGSGVRATGATDALVHCVDLFASILDVAGINYSDYVPQETAIDSISLVPVLEGNSGERVNALSESFGSATAEDVQAVTDASYKLIRYISGTEEFYDLDADENEEVNLLLTGLNAPEQDAYNALTAYLNSL